MKNTTTTTMKEEEKNMKNIITKIFIDEELFNEHVTEVEEEMLDVVYNIEVQGWSDFIDDIDERIPETAVKIFIDVEGEDRDDKDSHWCILYNKEGQIAERIKVVNDMVKWGLYTEEEAEERLKIDIPEIEAEWILPLGATVENNDENELSPSEEVEELKKEEKEKMMKELKKIEIIEQLKYVDTKTYYTDDAIDALYTIAMEEDIPNWEDAFDEIWSEDIVQEYIKSELVDDLWSLMCFLADVEENAEFYRRDDYNRLHNIKEEDIEEIRDRLIEEVKEAE